MKQEVEVDKHFDWCEQVNKILNEQLITQLELAELCQVSQQAVSNWCKGNRKPGKFSKRQLLKLISQLSCKNTIILDHTHNQELTSSKEKRANSLLKEEQIQKLNGVISELNSSDLEEVVIYASYRLERSQNSSLQ